MGQRKEAKVRISLMMDFLYWTFSMVTRDRFSTHPRLGYTALAAPSTLAQRAAPPRKFRGGLRPKLIFMVSGDSFMYVVMPLRVI